VIHGVGEGVLKNEVRTYLENQSGIEFYDSDFREYGKGATTIDFHPNW
jgi:dsDNA-specific endonuclease/ATPase MutS2